MEERIYEKEKARILKNIFSLISKEKPSEDIIRLILNKAKEILHSDEGDILSLYSLHTMKKGKIPLEKEIEKGKIKELLKELIKENRGIIKNHPFPLILSPIKEKDIIEGITYLQRKNIDSPFNDYDLKLLTLTSSSISISLKKNLTKEERIILLKKAFNEKPNEREEKIDKILSQFIGESSITKKIKEFILKASEVDSETLLQGETGVGKTLIAKLIHLLSRRSSGEFLTINCGTLPESLFETELFGHEKYSFTDAKERKEGLMEKADRGTLFLDEIEELSQKNQVKLLNSLEEKRFRRIGGIKYIESDFRLITSSNKNLMKEIKEKRFREDLFFRINVLSILIPPLRERKEDILPLSYHFLQKEREEKRRNLYLTKGAENALLNHSFPGNVRELKNIIKRAVFLTEKEKIDEETINKSISESFITMRKTKISKDDVKDALKRFNQNKTKAAEALGISRRHLYRLIEK